MNGNFLHDARRRLLMMRSPLLLVALLAGCDEQVVRVALYTQEQPEAIVEGSEHEALVRDAVAILGYEVEFVTHRRGALTLDLHEVDDSSRFFGRTLQDVGCHRAAWAMPVTAQVVAHEVGHMLGLRQHHDAPNNLMRTNQDPANVELTFEQESIVDANVRALRGC